LAPTGNGVVLSGIHLDKEDAFLPSSKLFTAYFYIKLDDFWTALGFSDYFAPAAQLE
jgi:hypothetical protein